MKIYSFVYLAAVTGAGCWILLKAARSRTLPLERVLLCGLAAIGPLYLTRGTGFYYYTLPDYYFLNVILSLSLLAVFQHIWLDAQRQDPPRREWPSIAGISFLVGVAAANKVTLLPLGAVVLTVLLIRRSPRPAGFVAHSMLAAGSVGAGFLFVIWWFYLFRFGPVAEMFGSWSRYVGNPGGESDFWEKFAQYLADSSYGHVIILYLVCWAIGASFGWIRAERRLASALASIVILGAGAAWAYFIHKRPAGTTFFEAMSALLALAGCSLTLAAHHRIGRICIGAIAIACTTYGLVTFGWSRHVATLRESASWARNMWDLHDNLVRYAAGRPVIVVHPQNHYGYGGVAEFLLKGTADVPTWNVTANGLPILHRYLPNGSFRNEYGGPHPDSPYPSGTVVFWVDRPEFDPMTVLFPALAAAASGPGVESREWPTTISGGRVTVVGHAIWLPEESGNVAERNLSEPIAGLSVTIRQPESLTVAWEPDATSGYELEFAAAEGGFMALGTLPPGSMQHSVGSLTPGVDYVVRIRKVIEGNPGAWTQVAAPAGTP